MPYDEGIEIFNEGIKEKDKEELYQLWLKRYVNPIQESKDYIEWSDFLDKHTKKEKQTLSTNKTDEETIAHANDVIEMLKRSRQ